MRYNLILKSIRIKVNLINFGSIPISVIFLEFWEDDGEIRLEDERAWFISPMGNESEDAVIERVFLAGKNEA